MSDLAERLRELAETISASVDDGMPMPMMAKLLYDASADLDTVQEHRAKEAKFYQVEIQRLQAELEQKTWAAEEQWRTILQREAEIERLKGKAPLP